MKKPHVHALEIEEDWEFVIRLWPALPQAALNQTSDSDQADMYCTHARVLFIVVVYMEERERERIQMIWSAQKSCSN